MAALQPSAAMRRAVPWSHAKSTRASGRGAEVEPFLGTQLFRGTIDGAAYEAAVRALLAAIDALPRLAPLLPQIDRERLTPLASAA